MKLKEAEERMRLAEQEDYENRQKGQSNPVIPAAIPQPSSSGYNSAGSGKNFVAGAVSGTESESEIEFVSQLRGNRKGVTFKWTPEYEDQVEELLIKHQFDFKTASREFTKEINKDNRDFFYTIDQKQLQLRWTDIEIRKYRLQEQEAEPQIRDELPNSRYGRVQEEGTFKLSEEYGANFDEQFEEMVRSEVQHQRPVGEVVPQQIVRQSAPDYNDLEELD